MAICEHSGNSYCNVCRHEEGHRLPTPDTEGKPCPTCHNIRPAYDTCKDPYHYTDLPAAQPANLADGGDSFEYVVCQTLAGVPTLELMELYPTEWRDAKTIIEQHKAELQALKSQLLAAVGEDERDLEPWEDNYHERMVEINVRNEQRKADRQAINTVYKENK